MGSIAETNLDVLRRRTQVDWDCLDLAGVSDNGMYVDATSNQIEVFDVISKPENAELLLKSLQIAGDLKAQYPDCSLEELAFDVAAAMLAVRISSYVSGNIHLMANPKKTFSAEAVISHGERYHQLCEAIDPSFDHMNRLVMKVACTWEGMQAARSLKTRGIKTLATTVFGMPQAVLAGEVGCVSISPFCHELKELMDETYPGSASIAVLCVEAQHYYQSHGIPTKVKACAVKTADEIMAMAGVDAFTTMPNDLITLAKESYDSLNVLPDMFAARIDSPKSSEKISYVDDEARYRIEFARLEDGFAQYKLMQAMAIFCDYQDKGEHLMRTKNLKLGGS